jgi:hypothetical protein
VKAISFGGGVQSTAMALLATDVDLAVFADTGWEPAAVLAHVERMKELLPYPVVVVSAPRPIVDEAEKGGLRSPRFRSMPLYKRDQRGFVTMGRRQCTSDYKISPIRRYLRSVAREWTLDIGISTDERHRANPSGRKWLSHRFPLLELGMDRAACQAVCKERLGYEVEKSACIGCPFKSKSDWERIRANAEEWESACRFDDALRETGEYLHGSCLPLRVALDQQPKLPVFDSECVGGCWL